MSFLHNHNDGYDAAKYGHIDMQRYRTFLSATVTHMLILIDIY